MFRSGTRRGDQDMEPPGNHSQFQGQVAAGIAVELIGDGLFGVDSQPPRSTRGPPGQSLMLSEIGSQAKLQSVPQRSVSIRADVEEPVRAVRSRRQP